MIFCWLAQEEDAIRPIQSCGQTRKLESPQEEKCHETEILNEKTEVKQDWGGMAGIQSRQHTAQKRICSLHLFSDRIILTPTYGSTRNAESQHLSPKHGCMYLPEK